MRGHNEAISCLAISPSGNLIASGQCSTTRVPNSEAMVIVWDYQTRQPVYRLMELHDGIAFTRNKVIQLEFSPDELFLAGCDDNPKGAKLCVWQCQTGQLSAIAKTGQRPSSFLSWGEVIESQSRIKKNATYKLMSANAHKVLKYTLEFDIYSMQYTITAEAMELPSSGLERSYYCAATMGNRLAAAPRGRAADLQHGDRQFRSCVPVSQGGLLAMAVATDVERRVPRVLRLRRRPPQLLVGDDLEWEVFAEVVLPARSSRSRSRATASSSSPARPRATSTSSTPRRSRSTATTPSRTRHCSRRSPAAFGDSSEAFITGSTNGTARGAGRHPPRPASRPPPHALPAAHHDCPRRPPPPPTHPSRADAPCRAVPRVGAPHYCVEYQVTCTQRQMSNDGDPETALPLHPPRPAHLRLERRRHPRRRPARRSTTSPRRTAGR